MTRFRTASLCSLCLGVAFCFFRMIPTDYVPWAAASGMFSAQEAMIQLLVSGFIPAAISRRRFLLQPLFFFT